MIVKSARNGRKKLTGLERPEKGDYHLLLMAAGRNSGPFPSPKKFQSLLVQNSYFPTSKPNPTAQAFKTIISQVPLLPNISKSELSSAGWDWLELLRKTDLRRRYSCGRPSTQLLLPGVCASDVSRPDFLATLISSS